jgi:hypothetical protein
VAAFAKAEALACLRAKQIPCGDDKPKMQMAVHGLASAIPDREEGQDFQSETALF